VHGTFFNYYPVSRSNAPFFTVIVTLGQGERGIVELQFDEVGKFMFHAHQAEFAELGWMGFFEVKE
jgi:FtsP/CotA-like multicopper oxidase with cupredoxin domain